MSTLITATKDEVESFIKEHLPKTECWNGAYDYFINVKKDFFTSRTKTELENFVYYIESQLGLYFNNNSIPSVQILSNSSAVEDCSILAV